MYGTIVELEEFTGRSFHPSEYPVAERALREASSAVDDACGGPFGAVEDDVREFMAPWDADLVLPGLPIEDVTEVEIIESDGTVTTVPGSGYVLFADGTLRNLTGGWGGVFRRVRVTYSHGTATAPGTIRGVTLAAAARHMDNPAGLQSEGLGDHQQNFGEGHSIELTPAELRRLERAGYRTSVGTVPIVGRI